MKIHKNFTKYKFYRKLFLFTFLILLLVFLFLYFFSPIQNIYTNTETIRHDDELIAQVDKLQDTMDRYKAREIAILSGIDKLLLTNESLAELVAESQKHANEIKIQNFDLVNINEELLATIKIKK